MACITLCRWVIRHKSRQVPQNKELSFCFRRSLSKLPLEDIDEDEQWYGDDLATCVQNAVDDVLAVEETMDAEDAEEAITE